MSSSDIDLSLTSLEEEWEVFCVVMIACWSVVLVSSIVRLIRAYNKYGFFVLTSSTADTNAIVAGLRIALFIDPRGWKDVYNWRTYDMLLRVGVCLLLLEWGDIIAVWWVELGRLHGKALGRVKSMILNSDSRPRLAMRGFVFVLTLIVVILTALARDSSDYKRPVNILLGVPACLITAMGISAAIRAFLFLREGLRYSHDHTDKAVRKGKQTAKVMLICLVVVPVCVVLSVLSSIARGSFKLSPSGFFAYLAVRGCTEVILCGLAEPAHMSANRMLVASHERCTSNTRRQSRVAFVGGFANVSFGRGGRSAD